MTTTAEKPNGKGRGRRAPLEHLSKSNYVLGLRCAKALYLTKHSPHLATPLSPETRRLMQQGNEVGEVARDLVPGGVLLRWGGRDYERLAAETAFAMDESDVLYEGTFYFDQLLARTDILRRSGAGWRMLEVKSGSSVKDNYLEDAGYQLYVLRAAGVNVSGVDLIHLDTSYVRGAELELDKLFAVVDVTDEADQRAAVVEKAVENLRTMLRSEHEPNCRIGTHCLSPHECPFYAHCHAEVPEGSTLELVGGAAGAYALWDRGHKLLREIPPAVLATLSDRQQWQVSLAQSRRDHVEHERLTLFLKQLSWPLSFLDFESYQKALPEFEGAKPYQQTPFQFSLHIQSAFGQELSHQAFLAAHDGGDPRRAFAEALVEALPENGSVLAFNRSFEASVMKLLEATFADLAPALADARERLVDLMTPFQKGTVRLWRAGGSYSIKALLPAVAPDLSYSTLEVGNGFAAMDTFLRLPQMEPQKAATARQHLLDYCEQDTWAMVLVLRYLQKLHRRLVPASREQAAP